MRYIALAFVVLLYGTMHLFADNWPQWRGPTGDGVSKATKVPTSWSDTKNVLWSVPLPGMGGSTPVIWGEKLFLTTENEDQTLSLLCMSIVDGKQLWSKLLTTKQGSRARGSEGNAASASPCTDGKYVYVFVGTGEFACFDLDGKEIWKFDTQERYGKFNIQFGVSSTPVLHQGKLFWQLLHTSGQWVICLNAADGKDNWKIERPSDGNTENLHSYASPQLWKKGEDAYLVVHGNDYTTAHDLKDGHEIWRLTGLNPKETYNKFLRFVASPVVTPELIIVPTAKNGPVVAVKPSAQGTFGAASPYEQWRRLRDTPDVPCPLLVDGLVYLCTESGVFLCIDAVTGKEYYKERIYSKPYRASPVYADSHIYCTARDGTITVLQAGKEFKTISVNKLPDTITASPVVCDSKIYLRGFEKLYCIGTKHE